MDFRLHQKVKNIYTLLTFTTKKPVLPKFCSKLDILLILKSFEHQNGIEFTYTNFNITNCIYNLENRDRTIILKQRNQTLDKKLFKIKVIDCLSIF